MSVRAIISSKPNFFLLTALALAPLPSVAAVLVQSDFSSTTEGWLLAGDSTTAQPTFVATGGNPGGMANGTDAVTGGTWYWQAPSKFLGNESAAYGYNLSYDERMRGSGPLFSDHDILLTGSSVTLYYDFIGTSSLVPKDQIWTTYNIPLTESGWKNLSNNQAATQSQFASVLSSLTQLRIRGEFITGPDNGDLDNVVLNGAVPFQVPEPGSLALLALGWLGMMASRRSRTG